MIKAGLVVGKFWPFHLGHELVIKTAQEQVDILYVFVIHQSSQSPNGYLRADAIRRAFVNKMPAVFVYPINDLPQFWNDQKWAEAFFEQTNKFLGWPITHVFSSEAYGDPLATAFQAESVRVDIDRVQFPISGTEIRKDPQANMHWIHPEMQNYWRV